MKDIVNQFKKNIIQIILFIMLGSALTSLFAQENKRENNQNKTPGEYYNEMQRKLASGWNTWNTRSVLSHVFLPQYFTVNLELHDSGSNSILKEALIGRRGKDVEKVIPGPHSYNGSYTELTVDWKNIEVNVKTAAEGKDLAIIVTPLKGKESDKLLMNPKILWGKNGKVKIMKNCLSFSSDSITAKLYLMAKEYSTNDSMIICPLNEKIILSTYFDKSLDEIESKVNTAGRKLAETKEGYGADSSLYDAMQSVLAWDVIYEPTQKIVISPVSRIWNCGWWNGWVLFDWDTYFASYMYSLDNKDLSYANAIAVTKNITSAGFVPNCSAGVGKSEDHSQPPVGSYIVWKIYERYKEKWFLMEVFDELLSWNRWWVKKRDVDGYLCWGSDDLDYAEKMPKSLSKQINTKQAAMWESGLDNSPMYDEALYDSVKHKLLLADVGLMSMYVLDCQYLSKIAKELGTDDISNELYKRAEKYSKKLASLYDEKSGIYLNKNLVTGKLSHRLSPTLFYPLLAGVASQKQAERMIKKHFYNPDEFWGEWIMPSIARNDSGFKDNDYWRGRIWAPMNFLVYCGLKNYNLPDARKDLVDKSEKLLLKSWLSEHHVYENYNSITGVGDDVKDSDKFYHWGALLGFIALIEEGYGVQ